MEKLMVKITFALILLLVCTISPLGLAAEEKGADKRAGQKAVEQELQQIQGMPVLKGDLWQRMTPDAKVAFIWGIGHVVAIEQHLREKYPEFKRDDFVAKAIEGLAGIPMNDVISRIDNYYTTNPDQMEKPVMSVVWDTLIKPNIKTGIAGRPLNKNP